MSDFGTFGYYLEMYFSIKEFQFLVFSSEIHDVKDHENIFQEPYG